MKLCRRGFLCFRPARCFFFLFGGAPMALAEPVASSDWPSPGAGFAIEAGPAMEASPPRGCLDAIAPAAEVAGGGVGGVCDGEWYSRNLEEERVELHVPKLRSVGMRLWDRHDKLEPTGPLRNFQGSCDVGQIVFVGPSLMVNTCIPGFPTSDMYRHRNIETRQQPRSYKQPI